MVVEHLRPVDQLLGQSERASGVAGQQDALGDVLVRAKVNCVGRHQSAT